MRCDCASAANELKESKTAATVFRIVRGMEDRSNLRRCAVDMQ